MSDEPDLQLAQDMEQVQADPPKLDNDPPRTGNHVVDRVLGTLGTLDDDPINEHVAVFEEAHAQLRGALDGPRLPRP